MGYIIKNTAGLINTRMTDAGRQKLSQGTFNISYFQVGDSEVTYTAIPNYNPTNFFVLEPSFNAQNSSGAPQSNKENVKYPYFVDGSAGNTYGIPNMNSIVSPIYNTASERGFFVGTQLTNSENYSWSALTNNLYSINSNYVVQMSTLVGTNSIDVIYESCNPSVVRNISVGDIITIYYDGNGTKNCNCSNFPTPTPTPTTTSTPTPTPSPCNYCFYQISTSKSGCVIIYTPCGESSEISEFFNVSTTICSSTVPILFDGTAVIGSCIPAPCVSSTPTPTPTKSYDPCQLTPTPTPTPSATFCPTPTPSNPCPQPPPPDCVVGFNSCYPILTYKVIDVCLNTLTLDRPTPDFSFLDSSCYGRIIAYPPNMTSLYDSITPSNHWSDSVINFESVCYTDQFDVRIWNMNIPWSENPAGLDSTIYKDYTNFGSINYLGSKEYFGYASSSGQTDTDSTYYFNSFDEKVIVTPEEQKAIAVIHYTNQTIDFYYGEKFALEPFDVSVDDTTGQARNFRLHIPWIMWHKNPECCLGQTFWVDPPGFDDLSEPLFKVHYLESKKNNDMNDPGIRYYHLWDNNPNVNSSPSGIPNRVGKVFPDSKIIIIDDEELIAALSYKSNRNWTLPAPKVSLITPNTCSDDNSSTIGVLTGSNEYMYVTYRLSNSYTFTDYLHCNYYTLIQGPNIDCTNLGSQNVAVRFGGEFGCLEVPIVTTTTTIQPLCPCWFSGLTLFIQIDPMNSDLLVGFIFTPSGQFLNGYPIFHNLFAGNIFEGDFDLSRKLYWDGTKWIFELENTPFDLVFNTFEPLGECTLSLGMFDFSGFSVCELYQEIILDICVSLSECTTRVALPSFVGGEFGYVNFDNESVIYYDSGNWIYETAIGDIIAILTGLTENDLPVGVWDIENIGFFSMTSTSYNDYFELGCTCVNIQIPPPGPIITPNPQYVYIDCYGLSQTGDTTQSVCIRTYEIPEGIITGLTITEGSVDLTSCFQVCTTTTTIPNCPPIITTTTTICPSYCSVETGFYADTFEILCQKVSPNERPNSTEWKVIDFTSQISGLTINGFLTEQSLTATTFVITQGLYDDAPTYNLNYLGLPAAGSTGTSMNFGDEYYFYGNLETDIQATIYEMRYKVNLGATEFLASSNPTWTQGVKPYISEIGLYDSDKNLMIISKLQSPYPRTGVQQFLIKFDF